MLIPKTQRFESKKLRNAANGESCVMCDAQDDTVVLAHLPHNDAGVGQKTHDWKGAFLCARCHAQVDGREQPSHQNDWEWKFIALTRTLKRQFDNGNLCVG